MENQINTGDQNTQQIGQNPVSHPVQIPEKPKINFWMFFSLLLLIILLIGSTGFILNLKSKSRISQEQQQTTSNQANETVITGVIRTSGLSEEEKQKLELSSIQFQITDFVQNGQQSDIYGYYLKSDNKEIEGLLGKCVKISGVIPNEWRNRDIGGMDNIPYTYSRVVLVPNKVERVDFLNCSPYSYRLPVDITDNQQKLSVRGVVSYGVRPAPDIGYDYQLKPSEPFFDELDSQGRQSSVRFIDIMPGTSGAWIELENNIGKEVTVEGYMVWGYSESRYLEIVSISQKDKLPIPTPVATKAGYRKIQLYYYNKTLVPKIDCMSEAVVPVNRQIPITKTPIQDTIRLLIEGKLTEKEKAEGFGTEFPHPEFKLLGANLKDRTLTLDFPEVSSFTSGGSCRVGLLRAQVEKTAKQFPEVREVRYTKLGIFQP